MLNDPGKTIENRLKMIEDLEKKQHKIDVQIQINNDPNFGNRHIVFFAPPQNQPAKQVS